MDNVKPPTDEEIAMSFLTADQDISPKDQQILMEVRAKALSEMRKNFIPLEE